MNPIFSVWLNPKKTTDYVVENKPLSYSIILFILSTYANVLGGLQESGFITGWSPWLIVMTILILGPLLGIVGFFVGSWLYTLVGKWLNGTVTLQNMRKAMGVIAIPNLVLIPVYLFYIGTYGEIFFQRPAWNEFTVLPVVPSIFLNIIVLIIGIWNIVVVSKVIGHVHSFSSWRGFGVSIIIGVSLGILLIPIILIIAGMSIV